jgi:hypothetical protein
MDWPEVLVEEPIHLEQAVLAIHHQHRHLKAIMVERQPQ